MSKDLKTQKKHLRELTDFLLQAKTADALEEALTSLLTPKELEQIPARLQIIKLLRRGIPHHEIANRLGVGVATVTRGARALDLNLFKNYEAK